MSLNRSTAMFPTLSTPPPFSRGKDGSVFDKYEDTYMKRFFLDRADTNKVGKLVQGKNTWKDFRKHVFDLQVSGDAEKSAYAK